VLDTAATLWDQYSRDQSPDSFLRLREAALAMPNYDGYVSCRHSRVFRSSFLLDLVCKMPRGYVRSVLEHAARGRRFARIRTELHVLSQAMFFNPGIHNVLSMACLALAQHKEAASELSIATALMKGILASGDGSEERPWLVLYIDDEYDILEHFKKEPVSQALVPREKTWCDRMECRDGSIIWFDVSAPYEHMGKRIHETATSEG
jgi:hypothetical protein